MFRILILLTLIPTYAAADWSPLPRAFTYDATFAGCTVDPTRVDVEECAARLRAAFDLNSAVAHAVESCGNTPLAECPEAFEDQGLPAIAARIASDTGCSGVQTTSFARFTPLPTDHCITMISDILRDEGVVPLREGRPCTSRNLDCTDLRDIHAAFWYGAVLSLSDTPLTMLRLDDGWTTCSDAHPAEAEVMRCHIANMADIWTELTLAQ